MYVTLNAIFKTTQYGFLEKRVKYETGIE